jgi:hypothetical protein
MSVPLSGNRATSALKAINSSAPRGLKSSAPRSIQAYDHAPLAFEPNHGQANANARYVARGPGYTIFLQQDGAAISLQRGASNAPKPDASAMINSRAVAALASARSHPKIDTFRIGFEHANHDAAISARDRLPGLTSYFIGNDPRRWRSGIENFGSVRYRSIYRGIDLVFHGSRGRLEFDLDLARGADPSQIGLKFEGAEKIDLDQAGNVVVRLGGENVLLREPAVYQLGRIGRNKIEAHYVKRGATSISIQLGAYDRERAVVIDPVVDYAGYFGGAVDDAESRLCAEHDVHSHGLRLVLRFSQFCL